MYNHFLDLPKNIVKLFFFFVSGATPHNPLSFPCLTIGYRSGAVSLKRSARPFDLAVHVGQFGDDREKRIRWCRSRRSCLLRP